MKKSAANAGDTSLTPRSGRSPGEGIDYSIFQYKSTLQKLIIYSVSVFSRVDAKVQLTVGASDSVQRHGEVEWLLAPLCNIS